MKNQLFGKDVTAKCAYCQYSIPINAGKDILCKKTGVMKPDSLCKKFKYDPLRRKPERAVLQNDFSAEDFGL